METAKSRLAAYDIIVSIDRSTSMGEPSGVGTMSRWELARESAKGIATEAIKHDEDGITISLFGGDKVDIYENVKDASKIDQIFTERKPGGSTPTGLVLEKHLNAYLDAKKAGKNPKPIIIACITDGQPDDRNQVKEVIKKATQDMDNDAEIGITFLQVGNDSSAEAFLKELDDDLKGSKFDIVNTEKLNNVEDVVSCLENALDD